ncbi:MAG TPA: hypothetical protein VES67_13840, partial [Vicinamibacterales bacterium]|nr:hypothetical protein [Vicinamibacterales bacterium]
MTGDIDAVRLALDIVARVGVAPFSAAVIVGLAITAAQRQNRFIGLLTRWEHAIPDERLESLLDELVVQI